MRPEDAEKITLEQLLEATGERMTAQKRRNMIKWMSENSDFAEEDIIDFVENIR